ncbi:hypothetical protein BLNAU_6644 [Blattamonas nauphoetae]|uniref:Uncharacterized protein n=1 Tax=Blattamonas nauphoetae TaxID=2049346 RepID=A0ABQ9Y3W6_9EUKA|nr:hypothetical protein BLNAU_6644 [Blattamonas nauphoetae]
MQYIDPTKLSLTNSSFVDQSTDANGGSVYLLTIGIITIADCAFVRSSARKCGGALFLRYGAENLFKLARCLFDNCRQTGPLTTSEGGGAVRVESTINASMTFLQFRDCSAESGYGHDVSLDTTNLDQDLLSTCDSTSSEVFRVADQMNDNSSLLVTSKWEAGILSLTPTLTNESTASFTLTLDREVTGSLLLSIDNSFGTERTDPASAPAIGRVLIFPFSSSASATLDGVSVGESGLLQQPLADYKIIAVSAPNYAIRFPTLKTVILSPLDKEGKKASVTLQGTVLQGLYTLHISINSSLTEPLHSVEHNIRNLVITTPAEPARIVHCIECLLDGNNGTLTVRFEGRTFDSPLGLILLTNGTHNWPSLSPISVDNTTHCSASFAVGVDESDTMLGIGQEYTLLGMGNGSTGCFLEDLTITVPTPSVFTGMNIRFKNSQNTSCVVELTGRNLVVHSQYNLTLNSMVSVVVRITSPTEGQSGEVLIGWPGHLQFGEECVVTAITRLDGENETIMVDGVFSATTESKPQHLNLYVSNESSDESVFCGEESRPCHSVDIAWKIVGGLAFDKPILELMDSPWLTSPLSILSGMIVVFRNGTGSSPTLSVSSSAHPVSSTGVVIVHERAVFEVHNVDIEILSSDLSFVFISATQSKIVLKDGSLNGPTIQHGLNEEEKDICSWTNGVLQLTNTTTTLSHQHSTSRTLSLKKELYEIEVKGSTLIPCGLFLEVYELTKEKKEGKTHRHPLSTDTATSFTETSIVLTLSSLSLQSLASSLEWRGRLVFGKEQRSDEWFVVQKDLSGRLAESAWNNMKWWIPLVVVLSCAALLALIIVVVCVKRMKGKKDKIPKPQMCKSQ